MRPFVLSALALAAACVLAAPLTRADDDKKSDDEKYTIKVAKFTPKGQPIKASEKVGVKSAVKITDGDGNLLMDVKQDKSTLRVYEEKTLEVTEGKRTKYSRKYEKAKDVDGDESDNKVYQGRTIIYEKSDGKWSVTAEGKPELSEDDLKDLSEQVNRSDRPEDALYPKKAVKVGDKWTLPAKETAKLFETLKMDPDTLKGEGKLVKAHKKGKQQWGTIEYVISFESDLPGLKKAKGTMKATIDQPIDGSSAESKGTFAIKWAGKQSVEQNCMKFNVDFAIDLKVDSDHVA